MKIRVFSLSLSTTLITIHFSFSYFFTFQFISLAYEPILYEDVWNPNHIARNYNIVGVIKVGRIPNKIVVIPYLFHSKLFNNNKQTNTIRTSAAKLILSRSSTYNNWIISFEKMIVLQFLSDESSQS